jgi:hypothetical protein
MERKQMFAVPTLDRGGSSPEIEAGVLACAARTRDMAAISIEPKISKGWEEKEGGDFQVPSKGWGRSYVRHRQTPLLRMLAMPPLLKLEFEVGR